MPRIIRAVKAMQAQSRAWRLRGLTIGLVPTMGALHAGHLSLIRRARKQNDKLVVSLFINPLQFGPNEDFGRYPRAFARDKRLCADADADILYAPKVRQMYPAGFRSFVEVEGLSDVLCGKFRPGHFRAVATVVLKLLNQVQPDTAYFGEKDFQQLILIRRLVKDLDLPIKIIACPIIRDNDGLAMSSRNAYLSPEERAQAPALRAALRLGAQISQAPHATIGEIIAAIRREAHKIPNVKIDYLAVVDSRTLQPATQLKGTLRLLGAIRIGKTRLIDNISLPIR